MISIILNKKNIPYLIIAALVVYILMIGKSEEIEVKIPSVENTFEKNDLVPEVRFKTIYKDSITKKEVLKVVEVENPVNKELLKKYEKAMRANDSLLRFTLYKEAITEKSYKEKFEDSVQVITVTSQVIGTLTSQSLHYKTKPQRMKVKSNKVKPSLFLGGFVALPMKEEFQVQTYGLRLQLVNRKRTISVGFDNKQNINFGIGLKLF
jgi:hypothetical protein